MPAIRVGVRKASAETDATPLVLVYVTVGVVVVDGEAQAYALPVQYSMLRGDELFAVRAAESSMHSVLPISVTGPSRRLP